MCHIEGMVRRVKPGSGEREGHPVKDGIVSYRVKSWLFCLFALSSLPALADGQPASTEAILATSTPIAVAFMISILVLKVTAFVLGYLIVRLGHDTMIRGVTGEVDFGFSGSGFETKLKSATPGAFFILMGSAIILWGITVEKPFTIEVPAQEQTKEAATGDLGTPSAELHRPKVPD